jgi:hypothetical protein
MGQDLIKRREQVMDRADKALNAAWPARLGNEYVREMLWATSELETIANEMQTRGFDRVEQSRTYRHLGSVYADLEPALGKEMLLKAEKAYQAAETRLVGQSDELERAKLNFNFGNTLRQIDPNDIEQLQEAKQRLLNARAYFAAKAPQFLTQVDAALQSVEGLLRIAPLVNAVKQNTGDMAALEQQLAAGGNVREIAEKAHEVMKRGGGAAGMVGRVQTMIDALPDHQRQNGKFADIQKQMQDLTKQVLGNNEMTPEVKEMWSLLNDRLKSEADSGTVSKDRAETLRGVLEEFGRILSGDEKDIPALLDKGQRIQEFIKGKFEMTHYPSYGIERPPAGSRAADLVELNWQLRRYLLEEMDRPEKGEEESKEALDLSVRASRVDRRIYEAGADNARAMTVEKEELRPLALEIRNFSARMHTMPARPIWRSANFPVDTNAVFYSGAAKGKQSIAAACRRSGLEIMAEPKGESYASARWKQIQKAVTAVFDLRVTEGPEMASVTYELGIALTLGKPVVVLVSKEQTMPFDVDVEPVVLTGEPKDDAALATAIDRPVVWTYPRSRADASSKTLEYMLSMYQRPQQNVYVDQTLSALAKLRKAPDPLAITRTLVKFFDYLKDGETMLVHPCWSPVYPEGNKPRLFHVMPFRPQWADRVTTVTREVCGAASVKYVRGDEVAEPNVIHSIWVEIARATHVLVDLTGFNANVALELGIVHTLGKKVLLVGQDDTVDHLFASIRKLRVKDYSMKQLKQTLGSAIGGFIVA